jgi:hypothetical protein
MDQAAKLPINLIGRPTLDQNIVKTSDEFRHLPTQGSALVYAPYGRSSRLLLADQNLSF